MRPRTPFPAVTQTAEGILSRNVNEGLPITSAIVGIALLGDLEDVLAVLRTAALLAMSLKAPLLLNLSGKDILSAHVDETPHSIFVSEILNTAREQLRGLGTPAFTMEVSVIAASFVSSGSITMIVQGATPASVSQHL